MFASFKNFAANESGAVTVDWVVLTAALVGLGLAVMAMVSNGIEDLSDDINDGLAGIALDSTFAGDGTGINIALGAAD